ncbi:MAG: hypothetical protein INR71_13680 [Terriglobus roseus]|nr:hypothetical protein [Terriglobus roseus]
MQPRRGPGSAASLHEEDAKRMELYRRHSDTSQAISMSRRSRKSRSVDDVDMDLAYGEVPPPLPARTMTQEAELRGKANRLQQLLDEANCLQHSVSATIEKLQKNPEALAAVGLALAEVSALVAKVGPRALPAVRGAFPAVFALLASPQFLIATGVGVGMVVVMLGGYKIIKRRVKDKAELDRGGQALSEGALQELEPELSHIEVWRRGIADAEADSSGTTVDGEFITPMAARMRVQDGTLRPEDLKSSKSSRAQPRRSKSDVGRDGSTRRPTSTRSASSSKHTHTTSKGREKPKREQSGLRSLFGN